MNRSAQSGTAGDEATPLAPAQAGYAARALEPGRILGSYKLRAKIGEGGMSVVYLATRSDDLFRRRVAIKLVPLALANQELRRRFHTERHILASLEHAAIARLYDAGTTDEGLPYFVMEHVQGERIDAYCDRHRLSIRERLALFRTVCSAVHYAHQNLVVHRDIKPSNILVTRDGVPKLLDFGIAKLLDPDLASGAQPTLTWNRMLTPDYASPEQVRGKTITTASDVYSLGVLLYKLLTGHVPHSMAGKRAQEIERVLTEDEAERPSIAVGDPRRSGGGGGAAPDAAAQARATWPAELRRQLAGDLDNIVLMALRKEPQRRYGSAEQLSEDLRRHLTGMPVLARKDTFLYRSGKLLRRNRMTVALASIFLFLVLGFAALSATQAQRANREAEAAWQVSDSLIKLLNASAPGEARSASITTREMLDRSVAELTGQLAEKPLIRAHLNDAIGTLYGKIGYYEKAVALLQDALSIRQEHLGSDHLALATSLNNLAYVYQRLGRYGEAEALYLRALTIREKALGSEDPNVAKTLYNLAALHTRRGRFADAEPLYRRALQTWETISGPQHPEIANVLTNLGVLCWQQGRWDEAERFYRRALDIRETASGVPHPQFAKTLGNLGLLYYSQGRYDDVEPLYLRALEIFKKTLGANHPDVGHGLYNLADLLWIQDRPQQAEDLYLQALAIFESSVGPEHVYSSYPLYGLARLYRDQERWDEAEDCYRRAFSIRQRVMVPDHPELQKTLREYADLLRGLGRDAELLRLDVKAKRVSRDFVSPRR